MIGLKQIKVNTKNNTVSFLWGIKKYVFGFIGRNVRFSPNSFFAHTENIYIEDDVFIGREIYMDAVSDIKISSGTMIGPRCTFIGSSHNYDSIDLKSLPYDNTIHDRKITIGKNVWIGANVMVCPGTNIGEGSVIGAGTCIYGNIPPFSVVVSHGYRIIKERDKERYLKLSKMNATYNSIFAGTPFVKRND